MKFWLQCAIAFSATAALDVVFAPYIVAVAAREAVVAGAWAAAIQFCNVVVVVAYVKDRRMTIPVALGAFVGTWLAVNFL